jgi:ribosomal protein L37E
MNKSDCEKCEGTGERTPPHTSALQQNDLEELSMTYLFGLRTLAFGETVAPVDVDTLRDEECPVCGESSSSFDGKTCQVCGFDAPPVMFRDPDLEKARSLDLRKDVIDDGSQLPGQDGLTQGQQDANGGMPGEVPGNGVPGSDQIPMDPSMLGPDGQSLPGAEGEVPAVDPAQIVQEQMEQLQSGQPLTPDMLGPDGSVGQGGDPMGETMDQNGDPIDPGALDANGAPMDPAAMSPGLPPSVDPNLLQELGPDGNPLNPTQGPGEFQQGPNGPEGPGGPEETVDPGALDANGAPVAPDGQQYTGDPAAGDPGTPEDGTADLICPACGYSTDAQRPTSTDMDTQAVSPAGSGDGTMAGDVCPNCGAATMESSGQMEQMAQQMEQPVNQPPAVNSNTMTAPV